jgi:ABC-type transporter MlaC component
MIHKITMAAFVAALTLGVAACDNKGPAEQVGEEVDEAVDTIKNGGHESTSSKVDDAVDDVREGAKDAADEVKK